MAETRTVPTAIRVEDFLDAVEPAQRREDARRVAAMMERVSGLKPAMWGPSIVGFGRYHYRYESGREGDMARISFSPRKAALVLYLADAAPGRADLLTRLGKHTTGQSCIYIKKLSDVDEAVLEEMIRDSLAYMDASYPDGMIGFGP